jgi:iron-sulfur cluster assembly protein
MITVTPQAGQRIQQTLAKRGRGIGIRIGVKTTGCSGLAYVLEYVDQVQTEDRVFNCESCVIVVDPKSLPYLEGLTIDYQRQGLNSGFAFLNPNERDRCGCGESFRV